MYEAADKQYLSCSAARYRRLLKDPMFLFVTMTDTLELIIVIVLTVYSAKIITNQFAQTASWSSILAGLTD